MSPLDFTIPGMTNPNANTMKPPADKTTGLQDLQQQCLRILRCTASALASTPGGLRFKAGTRPWLEGVSGGRPAKALPPAAGAGRSFPPHDMKPRHRGFFTPFEANFQNE